MTHKPSVVTESYPFSLQTHSFAKCVRTCECENACAVEFEDAVTSTFALTDAVVVAVASVEAFAIAFAIAREVVLGEMHFRRGA